MSCELAKEWMQDALDGRLGEADRRALATHLSACAACEAHDAQLRAVGDMLDRGAAADADVRAPEALLAGLNLEAAPAPSRRWLPAGLVAAGMLVLVGFAALRTLPEGGTMSVAQAPAEEITTAEAIHAWLDPDVQNVAFEF